MKTVTNKRSVQVLKTFDIKQPDDIKLTQELTSSSSLDSISSSQSNNSLDNSLPESRDLKMLEYVLLARLDSLSSKEHSLIVDFYQLVPYAEYYLNPRKFTQVLLLYNMNYSLYYLLSRMMAATLATTAGQLILKSHPPDDYVNEAKLYLKIVDPLLVTPEGFFNEWELECLTTARFLEHYCSSLIPL